MRRISGDSISPKTPVSPLSPREFVVQPFKSVLQKTKAFTAWQPPTLLGVSLFTNVLLYSYIVYPEGGVTALPASYPKVEDFKFAVWFLVVFCIYRMIFNYHFYQPLAMWLGAPDLSYARKFSQQFLNLQMHLVSSLYLYSYLRNKPWWYDISRIWDGWPEEPIEPYFMLLYMAQVGYHLNSLIFHFTDEVRRDFIQMFVHHTASVGLLVVSFMLNHTRYGSLILILSDSSDVIGCITKMANYTMHRILAFLLLPLLILAWGYSRCYLLAFWVGGTIPLRISQEKTSLNQQIIFGILIYTLVVLNYMWLYLLVKMFVNAAIKNSTTDLSEYTSEEVEAAILSKRRLVPVEKAKELLKLKKAARCDRKAE